MLGGPALTALTTDFNTNVANFGTAYRRYQPLLAIQKGTRCQPTPLARAHLQWPYWRPEELEDRRVLGLAQRDDCYRVHPSARAHLGLVGAVGRDRVDHLPATERYSA